MVRWCFILFASPLMAATTYLYTGDAAPYTDASVHVAVHNSAGLRLVPDGIYAEPEPNGWFFFRHSVVTTQPGPYLYISHFQPDVLRGYRRKMDGHLEPLPGFPVELEPGNNRHTSPVWMTLHPQLPIIYTSNVYNNSVGVFEIQEDGSLEEMPFLYLGATNDDYAPQASVISPDGANLFVNCYVGEGIIRTHVNPQNGTLDEPELVGPLPGYGRGLAMTEDGQYVYATIVGGTDIYGFRVVGDQLTPLAPFSTPLPNDGVWLYAKRDFLVVGGFESKRLVIYQIHSDGHLTLAPGSPMSVNHGFFMIYAAFDPFEDFLYFGADAYRYSYFMDSQGQLTPSVGTPIRDFSITHYGLSVSPENWGDPYSLSFAKPPGIEDSSVWVQGDPNTPFSLEVNGTCLSELSTGEDGLAEIPLDSLVDSSIAIKVYCEDEEVIARAETVPTLGIHLQWIFICITGLFGLVLVYKYKISAN